MHLYVFVVTALVTPSIPTHGALSPAPHLHRPDEEKNEDDVPSGWIHSLGRRGLEFENEDLDLQLRFGARAQYDIARYDDDLTPFEDDANFRRLRLFGRARYDDLLFHATYDFGGTVRGWKGVFLRYDGWDYARLVLGNQVTPFSLEQNTSSNNMPFLERSIANALATSLSSGVSASRRMDDWTVEAGLFGDPLDQNAKKRADGFGLIARTTWNPVREDDRVVHLGASFEARDIDASSRYRIRVRPESGLADERLVDTGTLLDVEETWTYGLEAAVARGPWLFSGEYLATELDRTSTDSSFDGWYLQASHLFGGASRKYSRRSGAFREVVPAVKGDPVWELSARVSHLDLEDGAVTGGKQTNWTLGATYFIDRNLRFLASYGVADASPNSDGLDEQAHIFQFRIQVLF